MYSYGTHTVVRSSPRLERTYVRTYAYARERGRKRREIRHDASPSLSLIIRHKFNYYEIEEITYRPSKYTPSRLSCAIRRAIFFKAHCHSRKQEEVERFLEEIIAITNNRNDLIRARGKKKTPSRTLDDRCSPSRTFRGPPFALATNGRRRF